MADLRILPVQLIWKCQKHVMINLRRMSQMLQKLLARHSDDVSKVDFAGRSLCRLLPIHHQAMHACRFVVRVHDLWQLQDNSPCQHLINTEPPALGSVKRLSTGDNSALQMVPLKNFVLEGSNIAAVKALQQA